MGQVLHGSAKTTHAVRAELRRSKAPTAAAQYRSNDYQAELHGRGILISMSGIHKSSRAVDLRDINFKEQTLIGSRVYTKREFETTVSYAAAIGEDLQKVVTEVVPLSLSETLFDLIADASRNAEISARIPAHRWGTPDDMKGPLLFLASSASDYVNGAVIPVDGGYLGR